MMKVKKKSFRNFVAVLCAVFLALISLFTLIPQKSMSFADAGASGFTDVNSSLSCNVSMSVTFSDNTSYEIGLTVDEHSYCQVDNGYSLSRLLQVIYNRYNEVSTVDFPLDFFDDVVWIYLNFSFSHSFDFNLYDFVVSDSTYITQATAFSMTGTALALTWEEIAMPLPALRYFRVDTSGLLTTNWQRVGSMYFRLNAALLAPLATAFNSGYYDQYFFAQDRRVFDNWENIYNEGYDVGYDAGYNAGTDVGYNTGYNSGYDVGYNAGLADEGFTSLISAVIDVPVQTFYGMLDFNILGVNMADFILSLMTLCLVAVILRVLL